MAGKEKPDELAERLAKLEEGQTRLEAKLDQALADVKGLQSGIGGLSDWVKRMVRLVKAK